MADEKLDKLFRASTRLYTVMLVGLPVIYLVVAWFVDRDMQTIGAFNKFILYMLLVVACLIPASFPLIRRINLIAHKARSMTDIAAAGLYTSLSIMLMAMISAVFVIGMACFLMSGELRNLLYFYPIGIAWALLRRPRRETFDKFVEEYGGAN